LFAGCGELEPLREPEVVDLELTTDALKASVRDAQRIVAELRADLELQRKELAEAQVARAQLEGRVREAERRVVESRRVIELQREELAAAQTERAHLSRNSLYLQGQMRRLQKQRSGAGKSGPAHDGQEAVPLRSGDPIRKSQKAMQVSAQRNQPSEFPEIPQMTTTSIAGTPMLTNRTSSPAVGQSASPPKYLYVKPGDTLWSIAQKYRVHLEDLRIINQLTDNRIIVGQILWMPIERVPMSGVVPGDRASNP
jgi:LysM repeat protein